MPNDAERVLLKHKAVFRRLCQVPLQLWRALFTYKRLDLISVPDPSLDMLGSDKTLRPKTVELLAETFSIALD